MKKIRLLFLTLVALIGAVSASASKTVYIQPNGWTADNAKLSLWIWTDGSDGSWATLNEGAGGYLTATFDDAINRMIFVRGSAANDWDAKWNQTGNIDLSTATSDFFYMERVNDDINVGNGITNAYVVNFNTSIATSSHDFQVASNWSHIVGSGNYDGSGPYYMSYSYYATAGVDGTGCLSAGRQYAGDNWGGTECTDLLITPEVKGEVTLAVKKTSSSNSFIEFYTVTGTDGAWVQGESISFTGEPNQTEFTTVTLNVGSFTRIGIRASNAYIDNFTAEEANIIPEKKITIASAEPSATTGTIKWEQQANGKVLVKYTVTVTNNGEVDLTQGMDGFSVSIVNGTSGDVVVTTPVPQYLAIGETSEPFDVQAEVETTLWPNSYTYIKFNLRENLKNSLVQRAQSHYTAYEPKFVFREAGSSSSSSISSAEAWGTIRESTTKNYEIANTGIAPLTINSIEIPEGFKSSSPSSVVLERADEYDANDAIWAAWTWDTDRNAGEWVVEDEGKFTGQIKKYVTFVRMNPEADDIPGWGAAWNQTEDLVINPGMTTYVIDSWKGGADDKLGGHWKAITLAKGETKAISITNDASVTGTYAGNLVIKYLDKEAVEKTYELAFSTTVIGLNTWTADFNNTKSSIVYPEGSVAQGGINSDYDYNSGNYNYWITGRTTSSYAEGNNMFITPKLHANAGDKLVFDVKGAYNASYFAKVYVSTDRKSWNQVAYYTQNETAGAEAIGYSNWYTKTISFDAEGDYYVAFALYGTFKIDNLVGLEKVDVAHDLYIKEVSWPDASIKSGTAQTKPSVTIIPLTNEDAANYTVKYLSGTTVLGEGTSKALTASATSSTDIAINWTPNVTETTVYPETKVVIEFTDGTKFETETFDLTVTNEPIFHFLNSAPSSKWYEPTDRTAPINFGKTNTADTQSFVIYNWGSVPLTVNSISLPEGFTTTTEFPIIVAAMDESDLSVSAKTLDITFSATESGTYSGDMVITYSGDQTFTLAVTGTKLDPTKFYATFGSSSDASNFPAGSLAQANISITTPTTDNGAIVSSSSTKNLFITPLLASEGETLQFDAKKRSSYYDGSVKVYALSDHIAAANTTTNAEFEALSPTLLGEYTVDVSDFTTYSVEIPTGSSYIALKVADAYVDEIYGLKVANVAHDWQIASSNIPTEAMQNVASTATVNILNLGIKDEAAEDITVTVYVNDEAVATGEGVALPMNHKLSDAGTQLSVSYIYPVVGTFPVYLEVKTGDYNVKTEPVDVNFTGEIAVAEGKQVGSQSGTGSNFGFVDWYNADGSGTRYTDILYTAAKISAAGIKAGDKITAISFKGSNSAKSFKAEVTSWVGTSTGDITYGSPDKAAMQQVTVYTGTISMAANEESVITLTEPIVWDGTSDVRVYTEAIGQGNGNWNSVTYAYDNELTMSYNGTTKSAPVAFFTLAAQSAVLDGTVKTSAGAGIGGATITLKAENGVQYSATADESGVYTMNVIQAGLDFTATVEKDGYLKKQFDLKMGGASKTNDVVMYTKMGIVGDAGLGLDWDTDLVMTQSTEDPNIFTLTVEGVNIAAAGTYEYKLRADGAWNLTNKYELPYEGNNNFGFGTTMYPAGTYNLIFTANTTYHTLTLQPVLQLTLDDSEASALDYENAPADVTVGRTLKAGWNAMVLPFDVTAEEIAAQFGANAQVAEFTGDEKNDDKVSVNFAKSDVITANVPFLLNLESVPGTVKFLNKSVTFAAEAKTEGTNFDFVGIYADGSAVAGDYIMAGGMLKCAKGDNAIKAYRSYLKTKGVATARISIFLDGELIGEAEGTGEATGIQGIDVKQAEGLYNMGGQKVTGRTKKGVYILNGKKVFVGDKH